MNYIFDDWEAFLLIMIMIYILSLLVREKRLILRYVGFI